MEFYLRVLFYPEVTSRAESSSVKNRNCRILEMCRMFSCFSINPIKCKGALSGLRQFLATETPLKMIKNGFCFTPNLFCSHDVSVFVSTFCSCRKKAWLERKLLSKFMMSQPGKQLIAIYMLSNISWPKDNQTMKFGQLI